ncbi:SusD/RagB family nutrient-binding outer membrane lipoprotein [Hymenobacter sp. 5516J-16]|nr:SusD/RagB family nutrient-binding outer membrane lipoprotein [Hymenobacter sp. 5516J-16]
MRSNVFRLYDVPASQDGALLIIQHWAKVQYTNEDRYAFRAGSYQSIWDGFYAGGLQDFNLLVRTGQEQNNPNMQAVGRIMRSYFFSILTDYYGDIPYSQALRIEENVLTPKYDTQEQVYTGLLTDLKEASNQIQINGPAVGGDILYNGDMDRWKRFANSLRLRLAMRISDVKEAQARAEIAELLNGSTPLISSNAQNAQLVFSGSAPNTNPIAVNRSTRDDHRVSRSITKRLAVLNDPRLPIYAKPAECKASNDAAAPDSTGLFRGVRNGLTNGNALALGPLCSTSKVGDAFTKADAPGVLMTYAEVLFLKAEAVARGFVTGVAQAEYNNAITASMNQYGITGAPVTAYLAHPSVSTPITQANYREVIGNQKWIALYGQGSEAWSEWRRLDYPRLPVAAASTGTGGRIPVRFRYPANEQSLNTANYQEAVARQGADLLVTKLWWDKF